MSAAEQSLTERRLAKVTPQTHAGVIEQVLIKGDLKALTEEQRNAYYLRVCESAGLNPLTQPFAYIVLNGKLTLYALRSATDQLRAVHGVSVVDMDEQDRDGVHIVTVKVTDKHGRSDMARGAVSVTGLKGENLANAIMKAETKAKRRATLSICGLGLLDETEVETIPGATPLAPDAAGGASAPDDPPPRQQPLNSSQAKKADVWAIFTRTLNSKRDLQDLNEWWADADTQAEIDRQPKAWQEQAAEAYEKRKEALA